MKHSTSNIDEYFFKILSLCFKNIAFVGRNGRIFQELRDFIKYCKLWIEKQKNNLVIERKNISPKSRE